MDHPMFTKEHLALRKVIRNFFQQEVVPYLNKWEEDGEIPRSLFKKMGDLGFFTFLFSEEDGGSGKDYIAAGILNEELGYTGSGGIAASIGVHLGIATPPIANFGNKEQKEKYLKPAIAGEIVGALAVTEPGAGSDVASLRTIAKRDGDYYILNGSKVFITNGVYADFYVVAAKTAPEKGYKGISLFIVEKNRPGFIVNKKLDKIGLRLSDTAELFFDEVQIPKSQILGTENQGFYMIMHNFQWERLMIALNSIGIAERAYQLALRYSKERIQFNKHLHEMQVVRHKLVEMKVEIEKARYLTYQALYLMAQGKEAVTETTMAKLAASEMAHRVSYQAQQLFGGYGYMNESEISRIWKDTRVNTIVGGTSEIMKEILAKKLIDES